MKSGALLTPILAFCVCSAMSDGDSGLVSGPFFGQQASRESASLFMDGFISTEVEPQMNAAFSIDGREFLYCTRHQGSWAIFTTREEDGRWLKPEPIPFASKFNDRDFTMAPNGKTIFFGSDRPRIPGGPRQESLDIFSSTRAPDSQWMEPVNVGPSINSEAGENYPSVAANGNLYFFSCREDRFGGCDLYVSEFREGKYQP
ncbi:MAG: hypothetical protein GY906_29165, partial [bacterium]|nr:hypothetical protein [bacterium]